MVRAKTAAAEGVAPRQLKVSSVELDGAPSRRRSYVLKVFALLGGAITVEAVRHCERIVTGKAGLKKTKLWRLGISPDSVIKYHATGKVTGKKTRRVYEIAIPLPGNGWLRIHNLIFGLVGRESSLLGSASIEIDFGARGVGIVERPGVGERVQEDRYAAMRRLRGRVRDRRNRP